MKSGFDHLMDAAALDIYSGDVAYIGIDLLPFWIKRELARYRKRFGQSPISWAMNEPFETEIQEMVEAYFRGKCPQVTELVFVETDEYAKELNEIFYDLGKSLSK